MDTPTLRPKRDRRAQPRMPPTDIADRAYELYQRRGGEHGQDMDDWLQAERELRTATQVPARDRDVLPTRTAPEDRDIVVRIEERDRMFVYVVTAAPGADQYRSCTAEEAVAHAVACAKDRHARAWFKGDNDCLLLEDYREEQRFRIDLS